MVMDPNPHHDPEDSYGTGAVTDPGLDEHTDRDERECPRCGQGMPAARDRCTDCQLDRGTGIPASDSRAASYEWQPDRVAVVFVDEALASVAQAVARTAFRRRGRDGATPSRSKQSVRLLDDLGAFECKHLQGGDWSDHPAVAAAGTAEAEALVAAVGEQATTQPVRYDADGDPVDDWTDVDDAAWVVAGVLRRRVRTFEDCSTQVLDCRACGPGVHAHRGRERVDARIDDPLVTGTHLWTCTACRRTRAGPTPEFETANRDREWPDTTEQERADEADAIGTEMAAYIQEHRQD